MDDELNFEDRTHLRERVRGRADEIRRHRRWFLRAVLASVAVASAVAALSIEGRGQSDDARVAAVASSTVIERSSPLPPCAPMAPRTDELPLAVEILTSRQPLPVGARVRVTNRSGRPVQISHREGLELLGLDRDGQVVADEHPVVRTSRFRSLEPGESIELPATGGVDPCGAGGTPVAYVAVVDALVGDDSVSVFSEIVEAS